MSVTSCEGVLIFAEKLRSNVQHPLAIVRLFLSLVKFLIVHLGHMLAFRTARLIATVNKLKPEYEGGERLMKRLVAMAALVFATIVGTPSVFALERGIIAEDANSVTPLLNGQFAPKTTLKTADGSPVSLQALTMQKPSIVLFYRGGWCPYCNEQLAQLKDIEKDLVDMGYQILAISPESPERLQEQKLETEFLVTLLSDDKVNTIREFGVGFYLDTVTELKYKTYGINLTKDESGNSVLPAPSIFILNKKGQVLFNYVNPDYKVRPSADLVLAVAKSLKQEM